MTQETTPKKQSSFPTFPSHVIVGIAKRYVDLYGDIREAPESFLWLSFCTYFGNLTSAFTALDTASCQPRLYGVLLGQSGRTRKSSTNNLARDFFAAVDNEQRVIEGFGSAEGIAKILQRNPKKPAILYIDEMVALAHKTSAEHSIGISLLHKLFEDNSYDHPLSGDTGSIRDCYLSFLGASTIESFQTAWSSKYKDAGFFSRFFFVINDSPEKRIPFAKNPDPNALGALIADVRQIVEGLKKNPKILPITPDAERVWAHFYESFGEGDEWNRIETYGPRWMVIQSLLKGEGQVSKETAQEVVELMTYEVAVRQLVKPLIAENAEAELEELIRRVMPVGHTMTKRELYRRINGNRKGTGMFNRVLASMGSELVQTAKGRSILITRAAFEEDQKPDADSMAFSQVASVSSLSDAPPGGGRLIDSIFSLSDDR